MAKAKWAGEITPNQPRAEDDRLRALHDAKGKIEREGHTYYGNGKITLWQVRRSITGSVKQLDIIAAGQVLKTTGPRRVAQLLRQRA